MVRSYQNWGEIPRVTFPIRKGKISSAEFIENLNYDTIEVRSYG